MSDCDCGNCDCGSCDCGNCDCGDCDCGDCDCGDCDCGDCDCGDCCDCCHCNNCGNSCDGKTCDAICKLLCFCCIDIGDSSTNPPLVTPMPNPNPVTVIQSPLLAQPVVTTQPVRSQQQNGPVPSAPEEKQLLQQTGEVTVDDDNLPPSYEEALASPPSHSTNV